jgi:hypothetical protein
MAMMSHVPLLLHPDPRRVLVICFGTGTTAGTSVLYPQTHLDVVDINSGVLGFADFFSEANHGVAKNPRARLHVDDGRNFLLTSPETFDVITMEPMPPSFAGVTSLYSREYYRLAKERLTPGGFVVQWLPFHLVTTGEAFSILRTMQDVFPETTLWIHGSTGIVVARRDGPVEIDPARIARAFADEGVRRDLTRLEVPGLDAFADLHMLGPAGIRRASASAPPITDDRPFLEYHASPYRSGFSAVGSFTRDQARALEVIFSLRPEEPPPLAATAPELAGLARQRMLSSHSRLGDLFVDARLYPRARGVFEAGLALAQVPAERAGFLFDLADLAVRDGRKADAQALLTESLALSGDDPRAQHLKRVLAAAPSAR